MTKEKPMRTHVSSELLSAIFQEFPSLAKRDHETGRYRMLLAHLLFGTMTEDAVSGLPYLSLHHDLLKKLALGFAGAKRDTRNWRSKPYLEGFQKHVPGFTWHEYTPPCTTGENPYAHGQTRRVATSGIPSELYQLAARDMGTNKKDFADHVYLDSLRGYGKREEAASRKETLDEVTGWQERYTLNTAQETIFKAITPAGEDGRLMARLISKRHEELQMAISQIADTNKRESQTRILAAVTDDARILYRPTPHLRTPRLHQGNDCVLGFSRKIRKVLLQGLTGYDLRNSQFAILAAYLNAPIAIAFSAVPDNSLWTYLHSRTPHANLPIDGYKPFYKDMIYSICFGMGTKNLSMDLSRIDAQCLLKDPMIAEILAQREPVLRKIATDGYITDLWGMTHHVAKEGLVETIFGDKRWAPKRWAGSLLGTYIQGVEMEIMTSVVEVINAHPDYQIVTWQHDGFTVHNERGRDTPLLPKLQTALTKKAEALGMQLFNRPIHSVIEEEKL